MISNHHSLQLKKQVISVCVPNLQIIDIKSIEDEREQELLPNKISPSLMSHIFSNNEESEGKAIQTNPPEPITKSKNHNLKTFNSRATKRFDLNGEQ